MENMMNEGFITFVDEAGNLKTLLAQNGTFSIVEGVSDQQAKEIFDHILTGRYRWLRYGQRKVSALR
jgi:hypothetical protein